MGIFSALARYYRQAVEAIKEAFIRALMGVLVFLGYVLLSLFIYAIMRRIMVPQKVHIKPVHLFFTPACDANSGPVCPFPETEFLLNNGKKLLSSGQYYSISLELELPESPVNEDVGVFMVNLTFYTTGNRFLSTSARPTMLHYHSPLLSTMSTLLFSPLLLLGYWEQTQKVDLVLYEGYYEPYGDGSISATVSILNHRIQLYTATLTIDANFSGFTYYLYEWPISMSIIVVVNIFITLCTCTIVMWLRDVVRDYDLQRRRGLQRRRVLQQQQQQQQQQTQLQQQPQQPRQPRQPQQQQRQPSGPIRLPPATLHPVSGRPPPPAPPPDGRTTPSSEASTDTLTGAEDQATTGSEVSEDPRPPPTWEESYADTESEVSVGFNEVLSSLQSLRRDIDDGKSSSAESSGAGRREGVESADQQEGLRHRTGQ